ncbi:efflux RND transporter permease subunit [Candidatus Pantoea soli]|uniref:Efflux pump membrane transporter n=1 Tax=Candidatus Pantoea soli TaxID=3098669 RepID=A0A518XJN4_9GAMM|nr:efflux RND transporter permease subunit [Pantoea soli]QDY44385.1 multidrug efflux RND transporter permease subunit [Pantoea soli]
MPNFFIQRPVFAWVVAIFIVLAGAIAIPKLPIARYPSIAPPSVTISVNYPGSTPQAMNESVISLIERELSGVKNLLYFESSSDTSGTGTITATFENGTDPELAQVDLQNKIKVIESRLPETVRQNGLNVEATSSSFLMVVGLTSEGDKYNSADLSDYFTRNLREELKRIPGVGKIQVFGAEKAMRVWINPVRLIKYGLSMDDVQQAITAQNSLVTPGRLGDEPAKKGQQVSYQLTIRGQLQSVDEFRDIILKTNTDGSRVLLSDVAKVEIGSESYSFSTRENGESSTAAGIQLAPGANALKTAEAVKARLAELKSTMPEGMQYSVPFDTSPFVKISVEKVLHTFIEAMILVFIVMYLFLQNVRYTFIPAIVAPIALLGTFTVMLIAGYSINVLTMFGMVLAIGIIVDDAIVVVENVERIMAEEGLSPKDATEKAMKEITGAVIGITLVLCAVFIPMGLASGSVGEIYRQFTLSMAVSILISAFLALSLTPALCATLLKPVSQHGSHKRGFFGWFNRSFDKLIGRYENGVTKLLKRTARSFIVYAALCVALVLGLNQLPTSFLPEEDQGYFITSFELPSAATAERTLSTVKTFEQEVMHRPATKGNISILGFSFAGSGPNSAMAFTMLKDWDNRGDATSSSEAEALQEQMSKHPDGTTMSLLPPAIDELGNSSGFTLRLQDRSNQGYEALSKARDKLLQLAAENKALQGVYVDGLPDGQMVDVRIDRKKALIMGVPYSNITEIISGLLGSSYVNDYPNKGRLQQVIIQADADFRMQLQDISKLYVRNSEGGMVPLSEFVSFSWVTSPVQMVRYQGYPALKISGYPAEGYSTGDAMVAMESIAAELPKGFAVEWTQLSLQEKQSASEASMLMMLSVVVIFLVLAALYNSWSVPFAVMMVVPLGLIGAVGAVILREMPNDVFFKVGMITIMGLSAKNAILIVEFAKQLHEQGKSITQAIVEAAKMRLRPILMTSFAFTLGVVPLVIASGASSETQRSIGTGVFGGMLTGTFFAIFFVPVFYFSVMNLVKRFKK